MEALLVSGVTGFVLLVLYLVHVNTGMKAVPEEAHRLSPTRWTEKEIRETYRQVCEKPVDVTPHLPKRLERRYVVVGGSGLVGGYIVLHLLARGQSPESIRIVDFRKPGRRDMSSGKAAKVQFVQADITSLASVEAAFSRPWSADVASLPLTVYHTAAVIRPYERAEILLSRCTSVNLKGTENVLAAAQSAGADIFIATSSGSLATRPVDFWIPPWKRVAKGFFQLYPDPQKDKILRPHGNYFGNYAYAKAKAERKVVDSNSKAFKTGCIRPCCGVYGNKHDVLLGAYLEAGTVPTWVPHIVQTFAYAENISLSHLQYESAILKPASKAAGKVFAVTDPNPPVTFGDVYHLLQTLTTFRAIFVPPVALLIPAYALEWYCIALAKFPFLRRVFTEPGEPLINLQPAIFQVSCVHQVGSNVEAERSPEEGGIGYRGAVTSLEAMCWQAKKHNDDAAGVSQNGNVNSTIVEGIRNVVAVPATVKV